MATEGERLASLEATVPGLVSVVNEIHGDVKTLLAAHNQQRGVKKFLSWSIPILTALGGALGYDHLKH